MLIEHKFQVNLIEENEYELHELNHSINDQELMCQLNYYFLNNNVH
jgi:hypothetical protein